MAKTLVRQGQVAAAVVAVVVDRKIMMVELAESLAKTAVG
jgi:hypothetical protein